MNIEQLEKLRKDVELMRITLEGDPEGIVSIKERLEELEKVILEELKNQVWVRYQESLG